jgi:hypothetical protein
VYIAQRISTFYTLTENLQLLNFTIARDEIGHPLLLNQLHFDPLYYQRRAPMLMVAQSFPSLTPFKAYQVPSIASAENPSKDQPSHPSSTNVGSFELAYEHTSINYAPDNPREWLAFLELDITGLRPESHEPKDMTFDEGPEQAFGAIKTVRILLSYDNPSEEKTIEVIELVPRESPLAPPTDDIHEKSIVGSDWGGRLNTSNIDHIWTAHVSFKPAEWNDCGRVDERLRQVLCKVEDFTDWLKLYLDPHLILTLFVVLCIILFTGLCSLGWLGWRWARASWMKSRKEKGRLSEESEAGQGLLDGDDMLEEGKDENANG